MRIQSAVAVQTKGRALAWEECCEAIDLLHLFAHARAGNSVQPNLHLIQPGGIGPDAWEVRMGSPQVIASMAAFRNAYNQVQYCYSIAKNHGLSP